MFFMYIYDKILPRIYENHLCLKLKITKYKIIFKKHKSKYNATYLNVFGKSLFLKFV